MAIFCEMDKKGLEEWIATRPPIIQDLVKRFPPDRLYLLKTSNHRVTITAYSEGGTLTVDVTGKYNRIIFDRQVFGINPDNLEECDLPSGDEDLGTMLTEEEDVDNYIDYLRKNLGH